MGEIELKPSVKYLTINQVAAHFSVSVDTIRRAIKAGEIDYVLIRKSYRIPYDQLERLKRTVQ